MQALHNYKLWNPNLGQYVAQPDLQTAEQIHARGGLIIADGPHGMPSGRYEFPIAAKTPELTATH